MTQCTLYYGKNYLLIIGQLFTIFNFEEQTQFNDFESSNNLDIQIDSWSSDSIWQIGTPQK